MKIWCSSFLKFIGVLSWLLLLSTAGAAPAKVSVQQQWGRPILFDDMLQLFRDLSENQAKTVADSYFLNQQRKRGDEHSDNLALQEKIFLLKQQGQVRKKNLLQELTDFSSFVQYEWRSDHPLHYLSANWIEKLQIDLSAFDQFAENLRMKLTFLRKTRRPEEAACLEKYYIQANGLQYLKENLVQHISEYQNTPPSPLQYDLINDGFVFLHELREIDKKHTNCFQDADSFFNGLAFLKADKFDSTFDFTFGKYRAGSPSSLFSGN